MASKRSFVASSTGVRLTIKSRSRSSKRPVGIGSYVLTIETERLYGHHRFYWTVCLTQNPDELLSWGHAPTREFAETAAANEAERLSSGLTVGGRDAKTIFVRRR